jgi:DNA-binding MarR family transcriptional regulator
MAARRSDEPDRGPLLGALLRFAHQAVVRQVLDGLVRAGFADVQAAQFAPLQALWDHPEGMTSTDLAAKARITKQSMGELVEKLASRGYVERVPDPGDGRAQRIRMTRRGRKAGSVARERVRKVEADWSRRLGAARMEALRETLEMLRRESDPPERRDPRQ